MATIPALPTAPYPEALLLDDILADAIAASDLDAVLTLVQEFAQTHPKPDRPLLLPTPGLYSQLDSTSARPLTPEESGSWFHLLLYNAGNSALRAEQWQLAVELYKLALLGCSHPSLFNNLGSAYRRLGRFTEARRWFERAIAHDPEFLPGYLRAATVILVAGETPEDAHPHLATYASKGGQAAMVAGLLESMPIEQAALARPVFVLYFPEVALSSADGMDAPT